MRTSRAPRAAAPTATALAWRRAAQVGSIGLEMVVAVCAATAAGAWADTRYGVQPWGTSLGLVVGLGAAGRSVARLVRRLRPEADAPAVRGSTQDTHKG